MFYFPHFLALKQDKDICIPTSEEATRVLIVLPIQIPRGPQAKVTLSRQATKVTAAEDEVASVTVARRPVGVAAAAPPLPESVARPRRASRLVPARR